ncbi:MAG TPA: mechanosensitive ion channel family protein [Bacillales bacterium]|nr:mechanosensitive ion channel family protein [Bacillales bacterium]
MGFFNDVWNGVQDYILNTKTWETFTNHAIAIIFIIIGAIIASKLGRSVLRKIFKGRQGSRLRMTEKRETTLERLVENAFSYVIYFIALIMILDEFTSVKGLIAGAGIAGLAIGFGAQNLVKDIITGFFIIFEDQFSVGDYVRVGLFEGYVEQIGLRTTKIQSWTGELHILPNSSINEVTNFSVNNSIAVVDISIAYEEDIEKAEAAIHEVVERMAATHPEMVRPPEILGVQTIGSSDIVIRVIAEVLPMEHWHIAREMRKALKAHFDEKGIEIPYPRLVTYKRDELEKIEEENMKDEG